MHRRRGSDITPGLALRARVGPRVGACDTQASVFGLFIENHIRNRKGYVGGVLWVLPERVELVGCWVDRFSDLFT